MRSLREGVCPIIVMTRKTAWLVDAGAGAVTTSATVEGTLMVWCGLAGRCSGGGGGGGVSWQSWLREGGVV